MSAKHRREFAGWYAERRRRILRILLGASIIVVFLLISALRSSYLSLQASGNQHAADRLITTIAVIILSLFAVATLIALWYLSRTMARLTARLNADFEASIADLPPEEQAQARRRREMAKTAMALGGYLAAHSAMVAWRHHQDEDVRRTRERNEAVNQRLEESRERNHVSWDDPV